MILTGLLMVLVAVNILLVRYIIDRLNTLEKHTLQDEDLTLLVDLLRKHDNKLFNLETMHMRHADWATNKINQLLEEKQ